MSDVVAHLPSFLTKVPFFSEVSEDSLVHLSKHIVVETYERGDPIIHKGEVGDAMYTILDGQVRVHEEHHDFGQLAQGDSFGEYALIDDETRSASITALKDTKVAKIGRAHFLDLMKNDQGFARGVLSVMIKRHRELDSIQEQLAKSKGLLERANGKMSGLINGAMDAIIMFDSRFRIILTNPSADALLENEYVLQRNVLFFFDDAGAELIESLVNTHVEDDDTVMNNYLPRIVKVIGSNETETLNEGTISCYGQGEETFYTLILRNIEERLEAEHQIDQLTNQTAYMVQEINELTSSYGIIAEDERMVQVLHSVEQVAQTDATVLITGETGTGKELVARAIHQSSARSDKPLIRINCGAIPANLIESELFGHEKGAFTGATVSRKGRFLVADKGTIFLDEIGELPLDLQPKLLRVIQEGEFDPLGSSETLRVDVRIIAATHRDLLQFSKEGKFREDLYYRLNVFPIQVPPLRDRGADIHRIAQEIMRRFSAKLNKKIEPLSEADKVRLSSYTWPGNVRELQNLIERAVIITRGGAIDWSSLIPRSAKETLPTTLKTETVYSAEEMIQLERENILRALRLTKWRISGKNGAATLLKLKPTTLASKIKALNIERPL